ncbi:MAG: PIN domain nuclease [Anaerolinea sp.]|nr:PIN domain nuclease [Anaerolinea sp.]MCC6974752.1 PIN domain nuclease [Anaerolineae bacterium]CAG1006556.1 putative PIN and TRAM-domain containing protein YacL [Anaerolineae bacterium]
MTSELALRLIGMVICTLLGARIGASVQIAPIPTETYALIFGLTGSLAGLILTPYVTTRPARFARRMVLEMPAEVLVTSLIGLIMGLVVAALFSVPLGLLPQPWSQWLPAIVSVMTAYLGITIFGYRARELFALIRGLIRADESHGQHREGREHSEFVEHPQFNEMVILMDSSAIIDGRILDISKTGFVGGQIVVPTFVLHEIQHIADESDSRRRARGKRGLEILEEMRRDSKVPVFITELDVEEVREVDHKLIALAKQMSAYLLTTDHNLNKIAQLQGVQVLNVNDLANAVKAALLPNEIITIQIVSEGKEPGQGVGYLDDGTMVVVDQGRRFLDRTIDVVIQRMIQTAAGKMYFARHDENPRK